MMIPCNLLKKALFRNLFYHNEKNFVKPSDLHSIVRNLCTYRVDCFHGKSAFGKKIFVFPFFREINYVPIKFLHFFVKTVDFDFSFKKCENP